MHDVILVAAYVPVDVQGQRIIPHLKGGGRSPRYVLIHPARGGDAGHGAGIDAGEGKGPGSRAQHDHGDHHGCCRTHPPPPSLNCTVSPQARGPVPQPNETIASDDGHGRIDGQQIAHWLDELDTLVAEGEAHPDPNQEVLPHLPPDELIPHQRPTGPHRQAKRQTEPPKHHVLHAVPHRRACCPLVAWRIVDLTTHQLPNIVHVALPPVVQLEAKEARPSECLRLRDPKDDEGHEQHQENRRSSAKSL